MKTITTEERNELLSVISDMYKDAYGFRNRSFNYNAFSDSELLEEVDSLQEIITEDIKRREEHSSNAIEQLEGRILTLIESGANDRKTAMRWILDSLKVEDDFYSFEFSLRELGISYSDSFGYQEEFKEILLETV